MKRVTIADRLCSGWLAAQRWRQSCWVVRLAGQSATPALSSCQSHAQRVNHNYVNNTWLNQPSVQTSSHVLFRSDGEVKWFWKLHFQFQGRYVKSELANLCKRLWYQKLHRADLIKVSVSDSVNNHTSFRAQFVNDNLAKMVANMFH